MSDRMDDPRECIGFATNSSQACLREEITRQVAYTMDVRNALSKIVLLEDTLLIYFINTSKIIHTNM